MEIGENFQLLSTHALAFEMHLTEREKKKHFAEWHFDVVFYCFRFI